MRRRQIIEAARDVLLESGARGLNPATVARRAGLARSSIYQYYESSEALLGVAVEAMMRGTRDRLFAALTGPMSPQERVAGYVRAAIADAAAGHRTFPDFGALEMPEPCRAALRRLHEEVTEPLVAAVTDLDQPDPGLRARFVLGVVNGAVTAVARGADVDAVTSASVDFVLGGLDSLNARSSPPNPA